MTEKKNKAKDTGKPTRVYPSKLSKNKYKKMYGGKFPDIKSRKKDRSYPPPEDEKAWMRLIADALNHRNEQTYAYKNGLPPPEPNTQYAYVLYHCRPVQIQRRSIRNKHRKEIKEETNKSLKGKHVHHKDSKRMTKSSTVVIDGTQHLKAHGRKWRSDNMKKNAKAKAKKG